jgi:hypothetical protein
MIRSDVRLGLLHALLAIFSDQDLAIEANTS